MQITFRQGIIQAPLNFLAFSGGHVSLQLPPNNTLTFTIADGNANYLFAEPHTVNNAWVGPFVATVDYWLYWDINTTTGVKTYGHTTHEPYEGNTAPLSPVVDQHWFDTVNNVTKVWNGSSWIRKIRVMAARMTGNSLFTSQSINSPIFTGTQVGSLNIPARAGYLIYDSTNNRPFRKSDGTFYTTEDTSFTGITSASQVKLGGIVIEARADANLPAYTMVRFSDFGTVGPATNFLIDNGTYGIIESDVPQDSYVNVVMEGLVTNPAWDWTTAGVNTPLYVNNSGALTTTVPTTPIIVATVVDVHTILLRPSSLFVNTTNDPATTTNIGSVLISSTPDVANSPTAVGINDVDYVSTVAHLSDNISHVTSAEHTLLTDLVATTATVTVANLTANNVNSKNYQQNVVTLVDSLGTVNWNVADGSLAQFTVIADAIIAAPTNLSAGSVLTLILINDVAGLHNVTFNAVFKWANGTAPDFSLVTGNTHSIFTFYSDGTSLFEVSRSLNIA